MNGRPGIGWWKASLERGRQIIQPLKKDLKSALESGLARGPAEAISVCRIEAPRIASEHSPAGVEVGRTSHRLRNPENAPRSWVRPLLDDYLSGAADLEPMALGLAGGRVGYVEPILVQPLCLACHGQTLAPSVADRIRELYPADQAVGFDAGDFRGVFWAEYPAP
jgi:hypothetical protein